jgi:hypothetical protein
LFVKMIGTRRRNRRRWRRGRGGMAKYRGWW